MNEDGPKYFMLAGPWTEKEKEESSQKITSLGGQMLDGVKWDQRCTHVITLGRPWTFKMSEKIMGALAAGRWVVTKRFLERSVSRNAWQKERPFLSDDLVLGHRRLWSETGSGVFRGMKVVFLMDDEESEEVKKDVYTRIVVAGGGHVDPSFSLKSLKTKMPESNQVTHVVVDPSILENKHPHFNEFKLWREYAATQNWLFYLHYKFFTNKIKELGNKQVTEESWSIFKPETQASAKKLREPSQPKQACSGLAQPPNKKQRTIGGPPVVVISDGEASDDDEIQYLGNKSVASASTSRNGIEVINLDSDDEIEMTYTNVQYLENKSVASASTSRNAIEVINLDSDSDNETMLNEIEVDESLENQFSWHQPCAIPIHHWPSGMEVDRDERNDNSDDEIKMTNTQVSVDTGSVNEAKNSERETFTQIKGKKKGKRIHCTKCEKKFNKEQTFSAHMKTVHGENVLNMKKTEKIRQVNENENTYRPSGMEVDRDERNDNSDDEIEMTNTQVSVDTGSVNEAKNSEREIFTQIKGKKKGKRIHCTKCEKKFNKEQTFSAHMKKVHGENVLNMEKTEKIRQVNENENTYTYTNLTLQDRIRILNGFKKDCSAQFSNN